MPHSLYHIPRSSPPVLLSFIGMGPQQTDQSTVLLAIIENMQPICRHFANPFPPSRVFDYRSTRVTIQNLYLSCGPLTYNDACTALRGLAEFMVLNHQLHEWTFQIWVHGYAVGGGEIRSVYAVLPTASAAGVATS